jgi:hypothetical protein
MRNNSDVFNQFNRSSSQELRLVIVINYGEPLYLPSHSDIPNLPANAISGCIKNVSSTSQSLKPDSGYSEIGSLNFDLLDVNNLITTEIRTKLNQSEGLKGVKVQLFRGGAGMDWSDFRIEQTQIVDNSITLSDGVYSIQCSDKLREVRTQLFELNTTTLTADFLSGDDTLNVTTAALFEPCPHVASYTDQPTGSYFYLKIKYQNGFEIVRATGKTANTFTGITRGIFGTKEIDHIVPESTGSDKGIEVEEYVYLELPSTAMAYALLTGRIIGGDVIPSNWHLGIPESDVIIEEFRDQNLDLFQPDDYSKGFIIRFQGVGKETGKTFIEKEVALLSGFFMLVRADGRLGTKRKTGVLTKSAYVAHLSPSNVINFGRLTHDLSAVINEIKIKWSWAEYSGFPAEYYRENSVIDATSISTHGAGQVKTLSFKGLHNSRHTFTSVRNRFNAIRDRYAGPPIRRTVTLLPTMNDLEVGDIVRCTDPTTQDFSDVSTLDRSFEIQKIKVNQISGEVEVDLFGSSQKADAITDESQALNELPSLWYSDGATNAETILSITNGLLDSNGTLTGQPTTRTAYYIDGDFTVPSGVVLNITENVELRVKGFFQIDGEVRVTSTNNSSGYIGGTRGSNGQLIKGASQDIPPPEIEKLLNGSYIKGVQSTCPSFEIVNASGVINGIPADMRGTVGGAGGQNVVYAKPDYYGGAVGGAGGYGGGSLIIISRGGSASPNSVIDISGLPGSVGEYDFVNTYAGSGGGGAPGILVWGIDGQSFPTPVLFGRVKAAYGECPVPGSNYAGGGKSDPNSPQDLSVAASHVFFIPKSREPYPDEYNVKLERSANEEISEQYIQNQIDTDLVKKYKDTNLLTNANLTYSVLPNNESALTDGSKAIGAQLIQLGTGSQYIQVDLGELKYIANSRVYFYAADGRRFKYGICISSDNTNYSWLLGQGSSDGSTIEGYELSREAIDSYYPVGVALPTVDSLNKMTRYVRLWISGSDVNSDNLLYEWELLNLAKGEDPYVGALADREDIKNSNVTPELIGAVSNDVAEEQFDKFDRDITSNKTATETTNNALELLRQDTEAIPNSLQSTFAGAIALIGDNVGFKASLLGYKNQVEVLEGQVTAHSSLISQTASKVQLESLKVELKGDISAIVGGDIDAALEAVLGGLQGEMTLVKFFVGEDNLDGEQTITSMLTSILLDGEYASLTEVNSIINSKGIEDKVSQTEFTPVLTRVNSHQQILESNTFRQSLTSFAFLNDELGSLGQRSAAAQIALINNQLAMQRDDKTFKGALAVYQEEITTKTTENSASVESLVNEVARVDNDIAAVFEYTRATVGYCIDADGNITDETDAVACVAANSTNQWVTLPLSEAIKKTSITVTNDADEEITISAGTFFQTLQTDVGELLARAFFGVTLPDGSSTGITVVTNEDGTINAINSKGAVFNWYNKDGVKVLSLNSEETKLELNGDFVADDVIQGKHIKAGETIRTPVLEAATGTFSGGITAGNAKISSVNSNDTVVYSQYFLEVINQVAKNSRELFYVTSDDIHSPEFEGLSFSANRIANQKQILNIDVESHTNANPTNRPLIYLFAVYDDGEKEYIATCNGVDTYGNGITKCRVEYTTSSTLWQTLNLVAVCRATSHESDSGVPYFGQLKITSVNNKASAKTSKNSSGDIITVSPVTWTLANTVDGGVAG